MGNRLLHSRPSKVLIALTWGGTAVAVAWAALAYLLPQYLTAANPVYKRLAIAAFFGQVFTFHLGLALAAAAAVGVVFRRRRLAAVAAVVAFACVAPTAYDYRPRHPAPIVGPPLRVMTANLLFESHDYAGVCRAVRAADPDVVAFEEYTPEMDAALSAALADPYRYRCVEPRRYAAGLAVYSKRPFAEPPRPDVDRPRAQIRVVVAVAGRPVAVYAVHPAAPISQWGVLLNRLQTADYVGQLAAEPLPVVMAGDWNFTDATANAAALRAAGLRDTHALAGSGRGSTWPTSRGVPAWAARLPGFRIDHVYLSPQLTCARDWVGEYDGSDHLPVVAEVGFAAAAMP